MQNLMPPIDTTDHAFHDGDPTTGQLGTIVTAAWLNDVQGATRDIQAEIIAVLTKAGIQPNPQKQNQLAEAISQIIGSGGYATSGDLTLGLSKKIDKADIAQQLGNDTTKVPSLQLVTTELGKKASVADANSKLAKDKNGADIPDKEAFIGNLGLPEKYQPKGNYQPAGNYADKSSASVQAFSGALRAPYIDAVSSNGDYCGLRFNDGFASLYARTGSSSVSVKFPGRGGDMALIADLKELPLIGSSAKRNRITDQRQIGVVYTNQKETSVMVSVTMLTTDTEQNAVTSMLIGGITCSRFYVGVIGKYNTTVTHTGIVLPGEKYQVTAESAMKLLHWVEVE